VAVRGIPLVTAACGTRVAWAPTTRMLARGGDGSQLGRKVRPVPGDHCIVGKGAGPRQLWIPILGGLLASYLLVACRPDPAGAVNLQRGRECSSCWKL
jgi:hypothetical protein